MFGFHGCVHIRLPCSPLFVAGKTHGKYHHGGAPHPVCSRGKSSLHPSSGPPTLSFMENLLITASGMSTLASPAHGEEREPFKGKAGRIFSKNRTAAE